jgi:hypothetical protein
MNSRNTYAAFFALVCAVCFINVPAAGEAIVSVPYHGMRMSQKLNFYVRRISVEKNDESCIVVLFFNAAVDPRSVTAENILVDDTVLPAETEILFNKAGTEMEIIIPDSVLPPSFFDTQDAVISVTMSQGTSFDGTGLSQTEFDNLACGTVYVFDGGSDDGAK